MFFPKMIHCLTPSWPLPFPFFSDLLVWLCPSHIWSQCSEAGKKWRWSGLPARLKSCVWWFQCNLRKVFLSSDWHGFGHRLTTGGVSQSLSTDWFMMDCHPLLSFSSILYSSPEKKLSHESGDSHVLLRSMPLECFISKWCASVFLGARFSTVSSKGTTTHCSRSGKTKIGHRNHNQCDTQPFNFHLNLRIRNN